MTGLAARNSLNQSQILSAIGAIALGLSIWGMGFETPPDHRGLFVASSGLLIAIALAYLASAGRGLRANRPLLVRVGWIALGVVFLLFGSYLLLQHLILIPYDTRVDPNQDSVVVMPLILPEEIRQDLTHRDTPTREDLVAVYKPDQIETVLLKYPVRRAVSVWGLAIVYGSVFAGMAAVGGLSAFLMTLDMQGVLPATAKPYQPPPDGRFVAFTCHSTKDAAAALAICEYLDSRGLPCWIAPRNILPGADWPAAIAEGIQSSKTMIVVVSRSLNETPKQILRELLLADNHSLKFFPVRLENAEPIPEIGFFLNPRQWIDAGDPPSEQALERLAEELEVLKSEHSVAGGSPESAAPAATQ